MGTWGPGVFENDHALDLCSGYETKLINDINDAFSLDPIAFDDLEGALAYVRLLTILATQVDLVKVKPQDVNVWHEEYLRVFASTYPDKDSEYAAARRAVISAEFDALARSFKTDPLQHERTEQEKEAKPPSTHKSASKETPRKTTISKRRRSGNRASRK